MTPDGLSPEDSTFRRFLPGQYVQDDNLGRRRLSSAALECRPAEAHPSCYIESIMIANDLTPARVLDGHAGLGLAQLRVETLRRHDYDATPDPGGVDPYTPHSCDVAHGALIEPTGLSKSALKRHAGKLAKDDDVAILAEPAPK